MLNAVVQINPNQFELVIEETKKIAADLSKNGVAQDELERAKKPILTQLKETVKTNTDWLGTVLKGAARHPVQIDWSRTMQKDYASITKEELSLMAKQYLDNNRAAFG